MLSYIDMLKVGQFKFPLLLIESLIFTTIVLSTIFANTVIYAQILPKAVQKKGPANTTVASSLPSYTPLRFSHAVKIISPAKGQQVSIGKNLIISGITTVTAAGNSASHCKVSIIANGVKPYQPAIGSGPSGAADYSKWNYVLSSKYATIKQGPNNKITAKYACDSNPSAGSFYSVNVTGVGSTTTRTAPHNVGPLPTATISKAKPVASKQQEQRQLTGTTPSNNSVGANSILTSSSSSSSSHDNSMKNLNTNKDPPHCDRSGFPSCYSVGFKDSQASPGSGCPSGHSANFCHGWDDAAIGGGDSIARNSIGSHNLQNTHGNALANSPHCNRPGWPSCYDVGYANGQNATNPGCPGSHSRAFCDGYRAAFYNNHTFGGVKSQSQVPSFPTSTPAGSPTPIIPSRSNNNNNNGIVDKIVSLCRQHVSLCGTPICALAPSAGVDSASCIRTLPQVRQFFNNNH